MVLKHKKKANKESNKKLQVTMHYLGGIDDKEKGLSLTGSATLMEVKSAVKSFNLLVDYGMFQGGINDDEYNKSVDANALKADCLILTHAHIDHSGRIPLLVKEGFSGPIYMTKETALQAREVLLDSVKIQRINIELAAKNNEKKVKLLGKQLAFVEKYENLTTGKHNQENKRTLKNALEKQKTQLGFDGIETIEQAYEASKALLGEKSITCKDDLQSLKKELPSLLFEEENIDAMFAQVEYIDFEDTVFLENDSYISQFDEKTTLKSLLQRQRESRHTTISVSPQVYSDLEKQVKDEIEKAKAILQENAQKLKRNEQLEIKLKEIFELLRTNGDVMDPNLRIKNQKELAKYNVKTKEDIYLALEDYETPKFDLQQLQNVIRKVKKKDISNDEKFKHFLESISLKFYSAGHIEGSAQVLISLVSSQVGDVIQKGYTVDKNAKTTNLLFSGDLGRKIEPDHTIGAIKTPTEQIHYFQGEKTYGLRNHVSREEAEAELFDAIRSSQGKVIIPTFAMQRAQTILKMILEQAKDEQEQKEKIREIKKKISELKSETGFDKNELQRLEQLKADEARKIISYKNIVLDSPLAQKIQQIYTNHLGNKYSILKPEVQEEIFGREMIRVIKDSDDRESLYSDKSSSNDVIITSSGMCEGGPILAHLPKMLRDKNATLVFIGYAPDTTIGGQLKQKMPVSIEGNTYSPKCRIVDIKGFSSHIGHEGFLEYYNELRTNKKTNLVLTHGTDARNDAAKDIAQKTKADIDKIFVPNLGQTLVFAVT